jgi:hypothetical protein
MNNADMPAYPIVNSDGFPTLGSFFESTADGGPEAIGLTKREHFAGLAMQGLLSNPVMADSAMHPTAEEWRDDIAEASLEFADALLAELDKLQE